MKAAGKAHAGGRFPVLSGFILLLVIFSIALNIYFFIANYRRSIVVTVPDGDSLQMHDGRRIRLLGLDAPERGRCLADEARTTLETIVKGRHVRLKNTVIDDYGRILANVIIEEPGAWMKYLAWRLFNSGNPKDSRNFSDPYINRVMVARGLARYSGQSTEYKETLREASDNAKNKELGIYSNLCRTTAPSAECTIKGNIRAGEKAYYIFSCRYYEQVIVDESLGDAWFCSEKEANAAGFKKASGCR